MRPPSRTALGGFGTFDLLSGGVVDHRHADARRDALRLASDRGGP